MASDNTISYQGKTFQIQPNEYRISFYKAKVELHEYSARGGSALGRRDGSLNIFYQGKKLKHKPISKEKIKSLPPSVIEQKDYVIEHLKSYGINTVRIIWQTDSS